MKRRRHLIPLSLFLLTIGICLGIVFARWWNLRTMFDFAGKNDRPVIAATSISQSWNTVILLSLDHPPMPVTVDFGGYNFGYTKPIFSPDGTMFSYYGFGHPIAVSALEIPLSSSTTSIGIEMVFPHITVGSPGLIEATDRAAGTYVRIDRRSRELDIYGIFDFVNQVEHIGEFHLPVPFEFAFREYPHVMASGDASRIFATDFTGGDRRLQMYDRSTNTWTEVMQLGNMELQCVSEDGSVVGLWEHDFDEPFIFVDGLTGEELHSTMDIEKVTIGERWAAGLSLVHTPRGTGRQFIVIDMEDDWKEYRFGPIDVNWKTVSLYEPPSGGIREMMEMRE